MADRHDAVFRSRRSVLVRVKCHGRSASTVLLGPGGPFCSECSVTGGRLGRFRSVFERLDDFVNKPMLWKCGMVCKPQGHGLQTWFTNEGWFVNHGPARSRPDP